MFTLESILNQTIIGDSREVTKMIPSGICNTCITSPPYFGLRDYDHPDQIGMEKTPEEYVHNLKLVFDQVHRILKNDGTLWLNLGDSYSAGGRGFADRKRQSPNNYKQNMGWRKIHGMKPKNLIGIPWMVAFALRDAGNPDTHACMVLDNLIQNLVDQYKSVRKIPDKVLCIIERMQKEYMDAAGNSWYLRQDIIWSKPNPMPESVKDRCTKSHEYLFLLSKSPKYYFDGESIKQPISDATVLRMQQQIEKQEGSSRVVGKTNGKMKAVGPGRNPRPGIDTNGGNQASMFGIPATKNLGKKPRPSGIVIDRLLDYDSKQKILSGGKNRGGYEKESDIPPAEEMANKKSVWVVPTMPFKDAHFATFPEKLIVDCVKAGCPEDGIVLDVFGGTNTTGIVSAKLNRNRIMVELNPKYREISANREHQELGIFK